MKHKHEIRFRRLRETLCLYLSNMAKYTHQPHAINLSDRDPLQHHFDTRFAQLNTSVKFELWQEALALSKTSTTSSRWRRRFPARP